MSNIAPMPYPRLQLFSSNGAPLAGGFVYSYAAGTFTPQATYSDATGTVANANPVVLDAAGSASIWLPALAYKIVVTDVNGVQLYTADNVTAVSLDELNSANSFNGLTVNGDTTLSGTGNLTVNGTINGSSEVLSGTLNVAGALTAASLNVTGNAQVGGSFSVTGTSTLGVLSAGATTVNSLTVGGQTLTAFVNALIPTLSSLAGSLVISAIATAGNFVIFTFGGTTSTRIQIAFGAGTITTGATIALPSGFTSSAALYTASMNNCNSTSGNNLDGMTCSVTSGGVVTATGNDNSGHTFNGTANWMALAWRSGV